MRLNSIRREDICCTPSTIVALSYRCLFVHLLTRRPAPPGYLGIKAIPCTTLRVRATLVILTIYVIIERFRPAIFVLVAEFVTRFEGITFTKPGRHTCPLKITRRGKTGSTPNDETLDGGRGQGFLRPPPDHAAATRQHHEQQQQQQRPRDNNLPRRTVKTCRHC